MNRRRGAAGAQARPDYLWQQKAAAPPGQDLYGQSDCTGSMVINLNAPVATGSTGVIKFQFVISDGGRHIHEVVSEFTPQRSSGPVPTQTSADDWKVGLEQED